MRLASWNMFSGKVYGGHFDLERLRRSLSSLEVDLIGLQEVDNGMFRSKRADLAAVAGSCLGGDFHFGRIRRRFDLGLYGNAFATRSAKLRNIDNHRLYRHRFWNEKRNVLSCSLELGGKSWRIANTHLALHRNESEKQLRYILSSMPADGPSVVMGDFNRRPHEVVDIATDFGFTCAETGPTYSSTDPQICIDWILVRNAEVVSTAVKSLEVSDHRAIVAELRAYP